MTNLEKVVNNFINNPEDLESLIINQHCPADFGLEGFSENPDILGDVCCNERFSWDYCEECWKRSIDDV